MNVRRGGDSYPGWLVTHGGCPQDNTHAGVSPSVSIMMRAFSPHDVKSNQFYDQAIDLLQAHDIPFLVGGAFALRTYTGIERDTKDFDIMMRPQDVPRAVETFAAAGYRAAV